MLEANLDKLYKLLETTYEELDKMKDLISKLQLEARKEALKDIPGVEGVFDGKFLISDTGEKVEVPANYAAKSRIVYGDRLKAYEEDGKQLFKQVEKVSRKKVSAVVSKKEGKFYALTEYGDHELSSVAVEFNNIQVNDNIQVILPEDNLKTPFATLDKSLDQKEETKPVEKKEVKKEEKKEEKPKKEVDDQEINKEFVMDLTTREDKTAVIEKPKKEVAISPEKKDVKKVAPASDAPFVLEDDDLR